MAPVIPINTTVATFTPFANQPNTQNLGTVNITTGGSLASSAAPYVSVAQMTPNSAFGGDIVKIEAGPGGDFGKGVYAISRGAGGNASAGAVNRPGVIYRVDPATGKASVFFDLNTVASQYRPGGTAANSLGAETGLVNWYDIAFDSEGYFDGKPSMFVSSVDRLDASKNVIYRVGPDGSFLGAYIQFSAGAGSGTFARSPSAVLIPPPEQQAVLRGLVMGEGSNKNSDGGITGVSGLDYVALFFDANQFRPGTDLTSATTLPPGVTPTNIFFGLQTGLTSTSTNQRYISPVYAAFTDFGTPPGPGIPGNPGLSGVQGSLGDLAIRDPGNGQAINVAPFLIGPLPAALVTTATTASGDTRSIDRISAVGTPYRRMQDVAFDAYGFFSYGTTVTVNADSTITVDEPIYSGSLFASDLGTGLAVGVGLPAVIPGGGTVAIPVQGPGVAGVLVDATGQLNTFFPQGNLGGRIVRIEPDGTTTVFAENFNTSGSYFSDSFIDSSLSITFSADGTTMYASDNDGIWQFKSVLSLAGSSTGNLIGLNDLRALGVPYEGQNSAVAILDTGIDANTPNFRGRVAEGKSTFTNSFANDDPTSVGTQPNGHGTLLAGVVAQFVPQATLQPVGVFTPNQDNGPGAGVASSSTQAVYNGMQFINQNPFVKDPIRPNKADRLVATAIGFGTDTTYDTEASAFKRYPQVVLTLKAQMSRMRRMGIQPIAAAGQLGTPDGGTAVADQGDLQGMGLPGVLNEVISVSGTYPFPYIPGPRNGPNDPSPGVAPRPILPNIVSNTNTAAGSGSELNLTGSNNLDTVVLGDILIFKDKLLASSNRSFTTDFVAPAIDVPTFRRTFIGDDNSFNVFRESGTTLSAGLVTGSYAVVSSALDYWIRMAQAPDGATVDAYLTQPVGQRSLVFGTRGLLDLSLYAQPDGVNSILQWTAVPAADAPNTLDTTNQPFLLGGTQYRNYSRVDIGNAVAAIEGAVALDYLFKKGGFDLIDGNKDGLVTAQELQVFVDNAATMGVPEMGAMARLLGGTARIAGEAFTITGETPDPVNVLQRRYNFFDYAANGELKGVVSIDQYRMLAHRLLPSPDAYTVTDRQRASNTGWLVDPRPIRNTSDLQRLKPTYVWVPPAVAKRFESISPTRFHIGRNVLPVNVPPYYTLFDSGRAPKPTLTPGQAAALARAEAAKAAKTAASKPTGSSTAPLKTAPPVVSTPTRTTPTSTTTTQPAGGNAGAILDALKGLAGQSGTPAVASKTTTSAAVPINGAAPAGFNSGLVRARGGVPAGQISSESPAKARRAQVQARLEQVRERQAQAPPLAPAKESGWDWVKNKMFKPSEWF
jgi:hypothetical protein